MNELLEMAGKLEDASVELSRVENLLSLTLTHIFEEEMSRYARRYEAVLESAFNKVSVSAELIDKLSLQLYKIGKVTENQ